MYFYSLFYDKSRLFNSPKKPGLAPDQAGSVKVFLRVHGEKKMLENLDFLVLSLIFLISKLEPLLI